MLMSCVDKLKDGGSAAVAVRLKHAINAANTNECAIFDVH